MTKLRTRFDGLSTAQLLSLLKAQDALLSKHGLQLASPTAETMRSVMERKLAAQNRGAAVFDNPHRAGAQGASVYWMLKALSCTYPYRWSEIVNHLEDYAGDLVFRVPGLKVGGGAPTVCCDIDKFIEFLPEHLPRKGPQVLHRFRERHSINS